MAILEIPLPGGVAEIDIPDDATDEKLQEILNELAASGEFADVTPGEPVTFGELPEGFQPPEQQIIPGEDGAPTRVVRDVKEDDLFSQLGRALGPLSSQLKQPTPQELKLTEPTEEGELPILTVEGETPEVQSLQSGLSLISDVFGLPERALGSLAAQAKGTDKTILQELGDPNSSLFKGTKQKLRDSGAPGVLKFLGEAGLSIISDPLFLGSIAKQPLKAGVKGLREGLKRKTVRETPEAGIEVGEQLQKEAGEIIGREVPGRVKGIEVTPAEKQFVAGIDDPEILAREAIARKKAPELVKRIQVAREAALKPSVIKERINTGIPDILSGSDNLTGEVAKDFDRAFNKFNAINKKQFGAVKELGDASPIQLTVMEKAKGSAQAVLPETIASQRTIGAPFRRAADLTDDEIRRNVVAKTLDVNGLYDEAGNLVSAAQIEARKVAEKTAKKIPDDILKTEGLSKLTVDNIDDAVKIFSREKAPSFTQLRNARQTVREAEKQLMTRGPRSNDLNRLSELRKVYTQAMTDHMETLGDDAVKLFKQTDEDFIDKVGIKTLKNNFYEKNTTGGLDLKPPNKIFDSIINSEKAAVKIAQLKKTLPAESFEELQKAYFNRIFEKASSGGVFSPEKFIKSIDSFKKDPAIWDAMLTDEMKDVLGTEVLDAVVRREMKKFKTGPAQESKITNFLNQTNNMGVRFAIARIIGPGKALTLEIARKIIQKVTKTSETKQAFDFFQKSDPVRFTQGLKQGAKSFAQEAVATPKRIGERIATPFKPKAKLKGAGLSPGLRATVGQGVEDDLTALELEATP